MAKGSDDVSRNQPAVKTRGAEIASAWKDYLYSAHPARHFLISSLAKITHAVPLFRQHEAIANAYALIRMITQDTSR